MEIIIQYLGISINTKVLSGGEEVFIRRIAERSDSGHELSSQERSFVISMAGRSANFRFRG